jgi:hypothetical protein
VYTLQCIGCGAFITKLKNALITFAMSVYVSIRNNSKTVGRTFVKFDTGVLIKFVDIFQIFKNLIAVSHS